MTIDELDNRYFTKGQTLPTEQIRALAASTSTGMQPPATAATNPGAPAQTVIYPASPGITYPNFKDNTGTAITIPATVGGNPVVTAFLVVTGAITVPLYTAAAISLADYAKTTDIANLIATTNFTNTIFQHPRGDSEITGTNSFNEVAASGKTGDGIYETMTQSGTVSRVVLPVYAYADSVIEIRVYKTSDLTTAPSTWTLLASKVFAAGTFNTNSGASAVVDFDTPFTVAVSDQIATLWNANAGTYPTTRYFTAAASSPARHSFLRSTATGGSIWSVAWTQSIAGFYAATFKFQTINATIDTKIKTAGDALAAQSKVDTQTAINNFDVFASVFTHFRGDAEIAGNNKFADTQRGTGVYEQMTAAGSFNRVTVPFFANSDSAVRFRVYKSAAFTTNIAAMTLLYSKNFAAGEFNTVQATPTIIDIPTLCSYNASEWLYILVYDSAGAAPMNILYWTADAGSAPARHTFLRSATPGTGVDPYTLTWTQSATGANFWSATFKLELTQVYLKARFDAVLAAANAYTSSVSSANPNILLPSKIYAVVGQPMNLYFDNFIFVNDLGTLGFSGWSVTVDCAIGSGFLKWWGITPTSAQVGTYSFTVNVYNASKNIIASKTVSLVVGAGGGIASVKHVLFCGDSTEQPGVVASTVLANITAMGGSAPVFHGTQSGGLTEGRGGWTYANFAGVGPTFYKFMVSGITTIGLNDQYSHNGTVYMIVEINVTAGTGYINCTVVSGSTAPTASGTLTRVTANTHDATIAFSSWSTQAGNPFWNPATSSLSIANYRTAVLSMASGTKFDLVTFRLGINDIGQQPSAILTDVQIAAIITNAVTLIAAFIADNATGKIIVHLPTTCNNTGGGIIKSSTYPIYIINMMKLWKAIINTFDNGAYNANVSVGFAGACINRFNGYPLSTVPVSARYSGVVENVHTNFVHPVAAGYQDIGDGITGQVTAMLKP